MILSMAAGQLDLLWSRMLHSLIITLLPSCFNDGTKIEDIILSDDIKLSSSLFLISVCSNV